MVQREKSTPRAVGQRDSVRGPPTKTLQKYPREREKLGLNMRWSRDCEGFRSREED